MEKQEIKISESSSDDGTILVGERIFEELCWGWINANGAGILKNVIRIESQKKAKRQNAFISKDTAEDSMRESYVKR